MSAEDLEKIKKPNGDKRGTQNKMQKSSDQLPGVLKKKKLKQTGKTL